MHDNSNLDPNLVEKINEQEKLGGIYIDKLPIGCKILVETQNSVYEIETLGSNKVKVQGGKHLVETKEGWLNGSTWGGSMLKINWIGYDMKMEFSFEDRLPLTTSRVMSAKIFGSDWEYELDWTKS